MTPPSQGPSTCHATPCLQPSVPSSTSLKSPRGAWRKRACKTTRAAVVDEGNGRACGGKECGGRRRIAGCVNRITVEKKQRPKPEAIEPPCPKRACSGGGVTMRDAGVPLRLLRPRERSARGRPVRAGAEGVPRESREHGAAATGGACQGRRVGRRLQSLIYYARGPGSWKRRRGRFPAVAAAWPPLDGGAASRRAPAHPLRPIST